MSNKKELIPFIVTYINRDAEHDMDYTLAYDENEAIDNIIDQVIDIDVITTGTKKEQKEERKRLESTMEVYALNYMYYKTNKMYKVTCTEVL